MLQWALLVLLLVQGPLSGAARYEAPLVYNQKQVRLRVERKGGPTTNNARWEPIANIPRTNRISKISTNRRACGIYVWDALSASMYHLCRYLMKDYVYEGRGGRKVRESYISTYFDLCHFTHSLIVSLFALSLALFLSFSIPVADTALTSASFVVDLFQIT
jgi:hypothetical protein